MALYAVKYRLTFEDEKADTWKAEIFKKSYVGSVIDMPCANIPVSISWSGKLFEPVIASKCTLKPNSQADFDWSEFYDAGELDYYCHIYKNGSTFWQGVYVPETYEEPYIVAPYFTKLRFSDLKLLKYIRYEDSGALYEQHDSLIGIIYDCLNKLPFALNLTEIINILENSTSETNSNWLLNTTYLDRLFFAELDKDTGEVNGMFCLDVLQKIMFNLGCSLFQWDGQWWVRQVENYQAATAESVTYLPTAVIDSFDASLDIQDNLDNNPANITWLDQSGIMKFSDVYDKFIQVYKYPLPNILVGELITDSEFTLRAQYNLLADRLAYWNPSVLLQAEQPGAVDVEMVDNGNGSEFALVYQEGILDLVGQNLSGSDYTVHALDRHTGATNTYFENLYITSNDSIQLTTRQAYWLKLTPGATPYHVNPQNGQLYNDFGLQWDYLWDVKIKIKGVLNTYYLRYDSSNELEWSLVDSYLRLRVIQTLGDWDNYQIINSGGGVMAWELVYRDRIDLEIPPPAVADFYTLDVNVQPPSSYSIGVWPGNQPFQEYTAKRFEAFQVSLEFKPGNKRYSLDFTEIANVSGLREREKRIKIELSDPVHNWFRAGWKVFDGSDYVATNAWYHRGDSGNTKAAPKQLIFDPYVTMLSTQRRKLSGSLYGNIEFHRALVVPVAEGSKIYYITSMNYNVKRNSFDVEMEEVATSLPSYTIETQDGLVKAETLAGVHQQPSPGTIDIISPIGNLPNPHNLPTYQSGKNLIFSHAPYGLITGVNDGGGTGTGSTHGNFPGGITGAGSG